MDHERIDRSEACPLNDLLQLVVERSRYLQRNTFTGRVHARRIERCYRQNKVYVDSTRSAKYAVCTPTGLLAAGLHHGVGNVNFRRGSSDLKVGLILGGLSVIGAVIAAVLAVGLPTKAVKLYIAVVVLLMGFLIFLRGRSRLSFSWGRLVGIGAVAAFNKGISGGGYGPLVTAGQIVSGVGPKSAVDITSLAEGLTCLVGVVTYLALRSETSWELAPPLLLGAILSVPLAALTVKWLPERAFTLVIGMSVLILGALSLFHALS